MRAIFHSKSYKLQTISYKLNARSAFTLIEVLIVLAITVMLSSFLLSYIATSRNSVGLQVEQAKLVQVIARAKSHSLATYNQPVVPCGFGVRINHNAGTYEEFRYDDFADCSIATIDRTTACNDGAGISCYQALGEATLPPSLTFTSNVVNDDGSESSAIEYIFFVPPDPKTLIWRIGGLDAVSRGRIELRTREEVPDSAFVDVNFAGQISF